MNYFVTGGSRGIGRGIVLDAIRAGHDVAFTYRAAEGEARAVEAAAKEISSARQCRGFQLDVKNPKQVDEVGEAVLAAFDDRIEVVVNNAGITYTDMAINTSDESWRDVLDTNLSGAFYVSRFFLSTFLAQRFGRLVHISSMAASGAAGAIAYSASKAGMHGLSASLGKEYGRKNITSNVLLLGGFETDLTKGDLSDSNRAFYSKFSPLGRFGRIEEVSAAVLFLGSREASYVNAQVLGVNGGLEWMP
jgi:NAD(P)-dependent dehydrogenase (short-subunit alcohol dehydrogenase family)